MIHSAQSRWRTNEYAAPNTQRPDCAQSGESGHPASYDRVDYIGNNDITALNYDYNENGIRIKAGARHFLIDSMNPTGYAQVIVERDGGPMSASLRRYAIGDDVLAQDHNSWGLASLLTDGHGSTRQLYTSPLTFEQYDYDAYGETFHYELDKPDSLVGRPSTDLLYAGEQWDAELGMQYLRARYYLPAQGIFNRLDPFFGYLDDPQSLHKYAYAHADPVNGIDPSGMFQILGITGTMFIMSSLIMGTIGAVIGGVASGWRGAINGFISGAILAPLLLLAIVTMGALSAGAMAIIFGAGSLAVMSSATWTLVWGG